MGQHGDEGVHAEQSNFPTHEVTDPGLRHAETLRRLLLGQVLLLNVLLDLDHEQGPQFQIGRFLRIESHIPKDIACGDAFLQVLLL